MINPELVFHFESLPLKTEQVSVFEWKVPNDLSYFDGHFPGQPILPGVAIIDATVVMAGILEGKGALRISQIRNAKFLHLIRPGMNVRIELAASGGGRWKAQWVLLSEDGIRVSLVELDFDAGLGG